LSFNQPEDVGNKFVSKFLYLCLKKLVMLEYSIFIFLLLYAVFLAVCAFCWMTHNFAGRKEIQQVCVSVVICARNEQNTIGILLQQLMNQDFEPSEIIIVNDGSTDDTGNVIDSFARVNHVLTPGIGKKAALKIGVERACGELIVCTDADCQVGRGWLSAMVASYQLSKPSLIIGPVRLELKPGIWAKLQALEFLSLSAVTAGSALSGHPLMCGGANMAFKRDVWLQCYSDIMFGEQSGDDMFFLMSLKARNENIVYLKDENAIVITSGWKRAGDFLSQRRRWFSKSRSYRDLEIILAGILVFVVGLLPLLTSIAAMINGIPWQLALVVLGAKFILDGVFVALFMSFFYGNYRLIKGLLPLYVIYPFYLLIIVCTTWGWKIRWK
jgi:cellulose synthase/poly-beta-1,6-N-acetylglucosamine synthase-like glycosyltransferase